MSWSRRSPPTRSRPRRCSGLACCSPARLLRGGHYVDAFRQGLRELGYIEEQNIRLEYRWAEGGFPDLAANLVRGRVDLIFAWGTTAATAAKRATGTIPIVFVAAADPVGSGLVASLARPGGNVTGLTNISAELSVKMLELLKQVAPGVARVGVLRNPGNPVSALQLKQTEIAARSLGVQLQVVDAREPSELEGAISTLTRERADALTVLADPMLLSQRARIADLAARSRLPAVFNVRQYAEAGGLLAYGPSLADLFHLAATYVDKILKGARPADLPVEQPTKFELVLNLRTARALGLTIPPPVLARADEIIQ